ncbi:sugar kinase [Demequina aurantiaca]|uniref:sugar kinase n=1 Tax=Demequina aurantiaca TaxID=676200 RepID=UPI0007853787|nr:sugar kinase [Demequina aurantiaca]
MTTRVFTVGEGLGIARAGEVGSLEHVSEMTLSTGGAEGNVAVGLARLGTSVTWMGRVGDDAIGRRVTRELRAEGVEVIAHVDATAPTGMLLKSSPSPGRTDVMHLRSGSAGSRLTVADLDAVRVSEFELVHVTGITPALSNSAAATIAALVTRARSSGVMVSVDVNHRPRLWPVREEAVRSHLSLVSLADVVFAGEEEAALLVEGHGPEELAHRLHELGPREVVVKLGASGALTLVDGIVTRSSAHPTFVVDTVGAGDAFVAGYLSELLNGASISGRLSTATKAGAAACSNAGDWEGAPRRSDLQVASVDPVSR